LDEVLPPLAFAVVTLPRNKMAGAEYIPSFKSFRLALFTLSE